MSLNLSNLNSLIVDDFDFIRIFTAFQFAACYIICNYDDYIFTEASRIITTVVEVFGWPRYRAVSWTQRMPAYDPKLPWFTYADCTARVGIRPRTSSVLLALGMPYAVALSSYQKISIWPRETVSFSDDGFGARRARLHRMSVMSVGNVSTVLQEWWWTVQFNYNYVGEYYISKSYVFGRDVANS